MLALASANLAYVGAPAMPVSQRAAAPVMETEADLKVLAKKLNPVLGYWNPLKIGEAENFAAANGIMQYSDEEFIGFFRQAEVKHGRVAMAAFVGFTVQSLGIHFPGNISPGISYESIAAAGGPGDQWDAIPLAGKAQIIFFVGLLEAISESDVALKASGMKHYMRGGTPGAFPSIKSEGVLPHPVPLDFFDPFGLTKKLTAEQKEEKLLAEINNGRWAMIGIFGCVAATKGLIVPGLDSLGLAPYAGEYMAPFSANW